jgi:hypothetical protein
MRITRSIMIALLFFLIFMAVPIMSPLAIQFDLCFAKPAEKAENGALLKTSDSEKKEYVLVQKTKEGWKDIFVVPFGEYGYFVWRDWVFIYEARSNENVQLYAVNLKNGVSRCVYDQSKRDDMPGKKDAARIIGERHFLKNNLYFSVGEYMETGAIFRIPLPPVSDAAKVAGGSNGRLGFAKGKYWLLFGEGDALWYRSDYFTLDPDAGKSTFICSSKNTENGPELIAIDKKDRMILSTFNSKIVEVDGSNKLLQSYTGLNFVALSDPSIKGIIVAKGNMPKGINEIKFSKDENKLYLVGRQNYEVDLDNNMIRKTNVDAKKITPNYLHEEFKQGELPGETIDKLPVGFKFISKSITSKAI